jgi:hypothetical protein
MISMSKEGDNSSLIWFRLNIFGSFPQQVRIFLNLLQACFQWLTLFLELLCSLHEYAAKSWRKDSTNPSSNSFLCYIKI